MDGLKFCLVLVLVPMTNGAIPGTFFWKPRLGLDLAIPTTDVTIYVNLPTKDNVKEGMVILIDGYQAGMTIVAIAAGISSAEPYPHLNPLNAYFYTQAYRWALRHFSLMPFWLGGDRGTYCDTHKIWRRRFFYMDEFVPKWMRHFFPYIKKEDWEKEEKEFRKFKKMSEPAFGKHYRYPNKIFNDFKSFETEESAEDLEKSGSSSISD